MKKPQKLWKWWCAGKSRLAVPSPRWLALAVSIGLAATTWAVTKPLAVWNADFPTSGSSQRGNCTLYLNGNTSTGDKVTISDSSSAHGLGVALSPTTRTIMAVAGISGIASATTTKPRILASVDVASQSDCRINMGLPSDSLYLYGYTSSISGDSYSSTIAWPNDGGKHYFGFQYDAIYGTTYYGTMGFVDGSLSAGTYYQKAGLVYKDDYAEAIYIGGIYTTGYNLSGAEVSFLAVLDSSDCTDVKYWSELAMTSVETVASDATSFTGGSGVGVNLNGGALSVTSGQTAQAIFVQEDTTLEMPVAASVLTVTKPLYVAEGKTLTIKLTSLPASRGSYKVIAAGNIFGDVVVDASAFGEETEIETRVGTDGVYIGYRQNVYWIGGASGTWHTASNWALADGTVLSSYPSDSTYGVGDHVIFTNDTTVATSGGQAVVSRITINADVTFRSESLAQNRGFFFDVMDGSGTLTLDNAWIAIISVGANRNFTIHNNLRFISTDSNSYSLVNTDALTSRIYGDVEIAGNVRFYTKYTNGTIAIHGDLSGTGNVLLQMEAANNYNNTGGLYLYGDNSGFSGTMDLSATGTKGGAYRNTSCLDKAASSSADAVWFVHASTANINTSSIIPQGKTLADVYRFGALKDGSYIQPGYACATLEIGARDAVASSVSLAGRYSNGNYFDVNKVGGNTLTCKVGNSNYPDAIGTARIYGGTLYLERLPNAGISFLGDGGMLQLKYESATDEETGVTTYTTLDPSALVKQSTAPIMFDDQGIPTTWTTALANSNTGGLTKKGAGTLTLTAVPQYSGATRVEEGTLVVPLATQLGDVYVAEGATLTFDLDNTTMTGALATFTSKTGDGEVTLINAPEGASIKKAGSTFMVVSGARTLTWAGPTDDDYSWATASNWTVGGEVATSAPTVVDDVVFNSATPGVVLTAAAEALSVTAPNGLTLATAYDLTVYDDFTVTGAFVKNGKGTLAVEGTLSATGGATITGGAVEGDIDSETAVTFAPVALSSDNYTASYGAKLTLDESRTFSNFGGSGTIVSSADQTYSASSDATFAGAISGNGGFTKTGAGTLTLIGNQTFAGDVTVSEGGLKLGTIEDIADIRYNLDASADDAFTTDEDGNITAWKSTVNSASYSFDHSAGGYIMADETTMMGSRRAASFQPDYSDVVQVGYACKASNWSNDKSQTILIAYNADSGIDISSYLWGQGNSDNRKIQYRYSNDKWYWPGDKDRGGFYVNGAYGSDVGVGQNRLLVSVDTGVMQAGSSSYKDTVGAGAKGFKGVIGQVTAFKRVLTMEEKQAAEAYLMAKWGINNATYAALPATADVSVAAGATLDLGGQTVTVASLNLSGTVQNGTLIVTGNNLTIANSTAAITATVKISGYDSSMTAPTGYRYSGNGDGTATLVPTNTWTGEADSDNNWNTAGNWSKNIVPGSTDFVVFDDDAEVVVTWWGAAACKYMTVEGDVAVSQIGTAATDPYNLDLYGTVSGNGTVSLTHVGLWNGSGNTITFAPNIVVKNSGNNAEASVIEGAAIELGGSVTVEAGATLMLSTGTGTSATFTLDGGAKLIAQSTSTVTADKVVGAGGAAISFYTSGTDTVYVNNTVATWVGGASGEWNTASNWSTGVVPTDATTVTFPAIASGAGYDKYTIAVSNNDWDPWGDRDKAKAIVLNAALTLVNVDSATGGFLCVYGDITGDENGSLALNSVGLDNASWNPAVTSNITCPFYIDGSSAESCWFVSRDVGFNITTAGAYDADDPFNIYCPITFGTLTLGNGEWINIGANRSLTVTKLVVADGATATLSPDADTATVTVTAYESVSPQYSVTATTSGLNTVYTSVLANVVPGTPTSFDDATAANNAAVVLTAAQTTQGLSASYYTTNVAQDSETGKWVVTAVLTDEVKPAVAAGATIDSNAVSIGVSNAKPGLCYRVVSGDTVGKQSTTGEWSEYYVKGGTAPTLSADLPESGVKSGVMYYSVEASDTK